MAWVDLHAHTNVSDGTLSPTALVEAAARAGLAAIAVTDHDHVGALPAARDAGVRLGVDVVTGIELSVDGPHGEIHLLGYLFDERDPRLLARLSELRDARERRGDAIVERLRALGLPITRDDVQAEVGPGATSLGRPHVARALMRKGAVASVQEAFDLYLAEGRSAYVPKARLSPREAIALVHGAGGLAVLAHPVTLRDADATARELAALGLDGIEVVHSKHREVERARFAALAEELGLVQTGGSDFHGDTKPDVALGSGRDGNVRVGVEALDALRRRKAELRP
jgi:predicted metal-dependent phosphoesterase TrpH